MEKVAIIGGGIAGISSAYLLQNKYQVTLFEKRPQLGGHTHTSIVPSGPDEGTPIDMGFIVCNTWNYPNLHKFFRELDVAVRDSNMSFGYYSEPNGSGYSFDSLNSLLMANQNMWRPSFWKLLWELLSINKKGLKDYANQGNFKGMTLKEYLDSRNGSQKLLEDYIVPMGASIWSTSQKEMLEFPAESYLSFFKNHGLFNLIKRPQWQTVVGGSHSYLKAFQKQFTGGLELGCDIESITRTNHQVQVKLKGQEPKSFDKVIFAVHADQVLNLLGDATQSETDSFKVWDYQSNEVILHSDTSILPQDKRLWASWNFCRENSKDAVKPVSVTYDMVRLQGLKTKEYYLVSLNRQHEIPGNKIVEKAHFKHPTFNTQTLASREKIRDLNGENNTYFVGSYFGYGFHEDAFKSSVDVANKHLGIDW